MTLRLRNNGWLAPYNSPLADFFEANEFLNDGNQTTMMVPAVNVFEDEDSYTIEVAAPGMDREDFNVKINEGVLTISAEQESEEEDEDTEGEYIQRGYNYDSFSRSFRLPEDVVEDEIEAIYENGELIVSIPKTADVVAAGREVEIS